MAAPERNTPATYRDQRVAVFADIQNLYHSSKHLYDARINYKQLLTYIGKGRSLVRALAYVVKAEELVAAQEKRDNKVRTEKKTTKSEASFFDALQKSGFELRAKDIQIFGSGAKKADWDVGIAIDAVRICDSADVIVLITGDGDFVPLVEYLRFGKGKIVHVVAFSRTTNNDLKEVVDEFIPLEDIPRALLKNRKRRTRKKNTSNEN